jgi:hypothetical protein
MISEWVTEAELEVIRWYQSLSRWQIVAVNLWVMTGDDSLIGEAFTLRHQLAA